MPPETNMVSVMNTVIGLRPYRSLRESGYAHIVVIMTLMNVPSTV